MSRELMQAPRAQLARLKDTVEHWAARRSMTKHQLEVLIGQLNDTAQVVPTDRPFLRNLLDAKSSLSKPHHPTRLNEGCRADLAWWSSFTVFQKKKKKSGSISSISSGPNHNSRRLRCLGLQGLRGQHLPLVPGHLA